MLDPNGLFTHPWPQSCPGNETFVLPDTRTLPGSLWGFLSPGDIQCHLGVVWTVCHEPEDMMARFESVEGSAGVLRTGIVLVTRGACLVAGPSSHMWKSLLGAQAAAC